MPIRAYVKTHIVRHSLVALMEIRDRIAAKVGEGPNAIYLPSVSEVENNVVLAPAHFDPDADVGVTQYEPLQLQARQ